MSNMRTQIGLLARSPEGHAAKGGMQIKGFEDLWVDIQAKTFTNWVNEHLHRVNTIIDNLATDFSDGTRLCSLVEILQKRTLKPPWNKKPTNQHQYLENIAAALNAISEDDVKLVNIGNTDIVNGNLKLIMGLVWSLIVRYQIGPSKFPPKKLMLSYLNAALPSCNIRNLTTDWNSGINLSALVDYCKPGLCPNWKDLDPKNGVENCRNAMELARSHFDIPMLLEPEYLASPFLDELSGMTYLSYFLNENSPGFKSTLNWVNSQIKGDAVVRNFKADWNDGKALCSLVNSLGSVAKYEHGKSRDIWLSNIEAGIIGGMKLGVDALIKAKDMVDPNVEHLSVMAYVARFQWIPPKKKPQGIVTAVCDAHTTRIYQPTDFSLEFSNRDINLKEVTAQVVGPECEKIECRLNLGYGGGTASFTPIHVGMHKITIYYEEDIACGCPFYMRAMPELTPIKHTGMEPCAVGSIVEVLVNSHGARAGLIEVTAVSPVGREMACPVNERDGIYRATFQPDEPGEWSIAVRHSGELIQGGPFVCFVFDPNGVEILGIDAPAIPEGIFNFTLDASGTGGLGTIRIDIVQDKESLPHTIDHIGNSIYRVSLHTRKAGKYKIYVYFNGNLVRGSPFPLRVGTREQMKAHRRNSSGGTTERTGGSSNSHQYRGMASNERHNLPSAFSSAVIGPNAVKNTESSSKNLAFKITSNSRKGLDSFTPAYRNSSPTDEIMTSPINGDISDEAANIKVSGESLQLLPINRPSTLYIHTDISMLNIFVTVVAPSGATLPVKLFRNFSKGVLTAIFTALEIGEHMIHVKVNKEHVAKSPFRSHAYNSRAIKVGHVPDGFIGQPVEFEIDGSGAGSGNLEILVNGGHVTSFVRNLGNQKFLASFLPHEAVLHRIDMNFNNEPVIGSPWEISIMTGGKLGPKMSVIGDAVRLVPANRTAAFQLSAVGFQKDDVRTTILSPSKRNMPGHVVSDASPGFYKIEFMPTEVGTHIIDVSLAGDKLAAGPLVAKVYNTACIRVTDVKNGIVGQPCQFKVDASEAGEGQLEISINEGEVPNHVTVVGGGRCLVSFTPELAKPHMIDIKFNGETVTGCPFVCAISDTSRVSVDLSSLELIPINQASRFHMTVDNSASAELSVSVTGPTSELPVKVVGNVHSGFTAEFTPHHVGPHTIAVDYNGHPVYGTPFVAKAYDANQVLVGNVPHGHVGNSLQFTVDASQAGEGNLEITISARGSNIPTQVHPQRNAKFVVSFVPIEPTDHIISIHFNKEPVPGSPFVASVGGDFPIVNGAALNSAPVGANSHFTMSNVTGNLDDIEVNIEGPNGQPIPALVKDTGEDNFKVEFCPKSVGEHKIGVNYRQMPVAGSPFLCKVYEVNAIKVKPVANAAVGQQVTFVVETNQAGPGNLEVTVNEGRVPTSAQGQGPHTYAISFMPRQPIPHIVDLRFNGIDVPGSPFTCMISEAARVVLSGEDKVSVNKAAKFVIECEPAMGAPKVQVLSPGRVALPVQVIPLDAAGRFSAQFIPKDVGDHSVEVKLNDNHVEGSPFLVKVYDATKVSVTDINAGFVGSPVYFTINASQAGAGNLEIIVSVNGCNVPNYVQSEGNAKFKVNFKPKEAAVHNLSVRFNGEPVPGSPFACNIMKSEGVAFKEEGVKICQANRPTAIVVDCPPSASDCIVTVVSPMGVVLQADTSSRIDNLVNATFTPTEVGQHLINVSIDGIPIKGSPFVCNVYNVDNIKVTGLGTARMGKPVTFSVDATEAGEGTLELVISNNQNTVKAEVVACSRGLYDVTFVPHQLSPHFVSISFNEENLPGSPFKCHVVEIPGKKGQVAVVAQGEGLCRCILGTTACFEINPHTSDSGPINVQVTDPDGKNLSVSVDKLESGMYRARYTPQIVGSHSVSVTHRKMPISKQPWIVQVFDPSEVKLFDMGEAFCNQPASFKVDARCAGNGVLSANIRAAGNEVKHNLCESDVPGIYHVVYHPQLAIPHKIQVKYNNIYISACPLEVNVSDPAMGKDICAIGLGLYQARSNQSTNFSIYTAGRPHNDFDVVITGPLGSAVPVRCYQQKDGNLFAEFTANIAGVYKIDVLYASNAVKGSPFLCQVYDASRIKVENIPNSTVAVNDNISFKLLRKGAGFAELDVTVRSPLGQDLPLVVKSVGQDIDLIELCPTLPGNFCFHITYGGDPIPDSPVVFNVVDSGVARAWGEGLSRALADKPTKFYVCARGIAQNGKPSIRILGPDNVTVPSAMSPSKTGSKGEYEVSYTPSMIGTYIVDISWNAKSITGSPFKCHVVDINKIRVLGNVNLNKLPLSANTTTKVTFDVSQAGPGELSGNVEGPHGTILPVTVEQLSTGMVQCALTPRSAGPHTLSLSYGGFFLSNSPFQALAEGGSSGVRVVLTGKGLAMAMCEHVAEFTIDGSQAGPGVPQVTLTGAKHNIDVSLQNVGNNVYKGTYVPVHPGAYLLNVMWSDRQVKGCPLKVQVNAVCDASRVLCSGDGLGAGTVGKDIRSFIDTRQAGPGELSAHCVGPHKVAYCELYDHGDGTFTLNVKPQEAGKHVLTVKYGGLDVPGSPFTLRVSGAPDASKVRVYGPGIEHGVLAIFQSRFICDTRGAGAGQLTVRVRGPKGAFRVEMQRESQKDRTILCKFDPTEPGDYRVEVKWAGEHVPGSPFMVMIFDTQQELSRYLQGGHSPVSDIYGSVAYSTGYAHITP